MPPSFSERQRHSPAIEPALPPACASMTEWMAAWSCDDAPCVSVSTWPRQSCCSCAKAEAGANSASAITRASNVRPRMRLSLGAVLRRAPALEIGRGRNAHDGVAGVDEGDLARHARREIAKQVECRSAHMFQFQVLLERRVVLVPFEDSARVADGGARPRALSRRRSGARRGARQRDLG